MTNKNYLDDISEIKNLMNRSSRFLSLSGLSGVLVGIYALLGSFFAFTLLEDKTVYIQPTSSENMMLVYKLVSIAIVVAVLAIVTAILLTSKKARTNNEQIWDKTSKNMLIHFLIPLLTGGVFGCILLYHEHFGIIAPVTLIFYGLGLLNASKYTLDTVKYLGLSEIIVGLLAALFVGYGLYFWAFGFGVLHIVYGTFMYFKEKSINR